MTIPDPRLVRCAVAECRVEPVPVVVDQVLQNIVAGNGSVRPDLRADLGFQGGEPAFGSRVVVTRTGTARRRPQPRPSERGPELSRRVLRSLVGIKPNSA